MKKTLFTFMALAMAFAVTSCQSEEELPLEEPSQEPENGIVFVDLGLPSGTKWATCNYGASSPTECGSCILFDSIPDGTPTQSEWEELMKYCHITSNGDGSVKIANPATYNRNDFIILPSYGGYYVDGDYRDTDTRYWFCNSLGYNEQRMISVNNVSADWRISSEYIGYTFKCFVRQVQRPQ